METPLNKTGQCNRPSVHGVPAAVLWLFFTGWVLWGLFFDSPARAQHLKPVSVGAVLNPMDWQGLYDPGQVVSNALNQYGKNSAAFRWVTVEESAREQAAKNTGKNDETLDIPQDMLEEKKKTEEKPLPVQFVVEGELLMFNPRVSAPVSLAVAEPGGNYAEIHFHCRVIHNLTGRVAAETVLWAVGSGGTAPFSDSPESLIPGHPDFQKTSMGNAVEQLTAKTFGFLREALARFPLEAQVLAADAELNQMTLNTGTRNGVEVGDEFSIYRLTLGVKDPITGADLGDRFKKMGVVRVMEVGDGFSESAVLVGDWFKQGDVARISAPQGGEHVAGRKNPDGVLVKQQDDSGLFNRTGPERAFPRKTISSLDVFDLFGFELSY